MGFLFSTISEDIKEVQQCIGQVYGRHSIWNSQC